MRKLLVHCAHHILGPFGPDSALRCWGLELAARGGKNAKKRALVAVARKLAVLLHKLAVLLHKLWVTGEYTNLCECAGVAKRRRHEVEIEFWKGSSSSGD